jgi:hypothetical protein
MLNRQGFRRSRSMRIWNYYNCILLESPPRIPNREPGTQVEIRSDAFVTQAESSVAALLCSVTRNMEDESYCCPFRLLGDNEFHRIQDMCHLTVNLTQCYLNNAWITNCSGNEYVCCGKNRLVLKEWHLHITQSAGSPTYLIKFISILKVRATVTAKRVWLLTCNYNYSPPRIKTLVTPPSGSHEYYCEFISRKPVIKLRTCIETRKRKCSDYLSTNKLFRKCG